MDGAATGVSGVDTASVRNRLLLALSPVELAALAPMLERVRLRARQTLVEPQMPIENVYFVEAGQASMLSRDKLHQRPIEISLIGRFGLVGLPVALGTNRSPHRCVVQIGGVALRMATTDLRDAIEHSSRLRQVLLSYVQARMVQQAQITVCNTRHTLEQRLGRWLSMALDLADNGEVHATHELISRMLGIRRPSVTLAIGRMEAAGILKRGRGRLTILDRDKLAAVTCECHAFVRAEYERHFGPVEGAPV